jgi:hypothetical protein
MIVGTQGCSSDSKDTGDKIPNSSDMEVGSDTGTDGVQSDREETESGTDTTSSDEGTAASDESSDVETDSSSEVSTDGDGGVSEDTDTDTFEVETGSDTFEDTTGLGTDTSDWSSDSATSDTDADTIDNEVHRLCFDDCLDFPDAPILESELDAEDIAVFEDPGNFTEPGPCIVEPQLSDGDLPGALFPSDWLRPRFRFVPGGKEDLFEIRLHADREKYDLIVYTRDTTWVMPETIWAGLTETALDEPITVTIRGVNSLYPETPSGSQGTFQIAPVKAGGELVFFSAVSPKVTPDSAKLSGLVVGEEASFDVLTVNDVGDRNILESSGLTERKASYGVEAGYVQCVGCHAAVPGGTTVAFTDHWPWSVVLSSIENDGAEETAAGGVPSFLSRGAEDLLNQPWLGMSAFSKAHFNENEKVLITSYGERYTDNGGNIGYTPTIPAKDVLAWFDLMTDVSVYVSPDYPGDIAAERNRLVEDAFGIGFGLLSLYGETLSAVSPDWSHDGSTIAYTAASKTQDGRISGGTLQTDVDIHVVPYNDGLGGTVSCVQGACEKSAAEYYPTFSADDKLLAFNREADFRAMKTVFTQFDFPLNSIDVDGSVEDVYYRPHAEIFIVPSTGGTPMRLAANDPPRCTAQTSPGIINSRPRWSPDVKTTPAEFGSERSVYWIVFSSARAYPEQFILEADKYSPKDTRASQLYIAAVVRNEATGEYVTYPSVYIWNQAKDTSNLTPSWNDFKIVAPSNKQLHTK